MAKRIIEALVHIEVEDREMTEDDKVAAYGSMREAAKYEGQSQVNQSDPYELLEPVQDLVDNHEVWAGSNTWANYRAIKVISAKFLPEYPE